MRQDLNLEILNNSFGFQLTGSRYFGYQSNKSDWDFFVQERPKREVEKWLISRGFRCISQPTHYKDKMCLTVWRWEDETNQIDVQIVRDAELKQKCQQWLSHFPYALKETPKHRHAYFWDLALALKRDLKSDRDQYDHDFKRRRTGHLEQQIAIFGGHDGIAA